VLNPCSVRRQNRKHRVLQQHVLHWRVQLRRHFQSLHLLCDLPPIAVFSFTPCFMRAVVLLSLSVRAFLT